nr:hypothetical protein [uncultured Prevotella sp.]
MKETRHVFRKPDKSVSPTEKRKVAGALVSSRYIFDKKLSKRLGSYKE